MYLTNWSRRLASSDSKTLVFTDSISKLSACLAYVEFLAEFVRIFVDNIRHAEFRNLIFEVEPCKHCRGVHLTNVNPDSFEILAKLRNENDLEYLES